MTYLAQKQADVQAIATSLLDNLFTPNTLLESNINFKDSEHLYQTVVQNVTVGIVKHAIDGRIVLFNKVALEMLGLSEDELYGKTSIDPSWNVIHEDGSDFPGNTHPAAVAMATQQAVKDVVMGVYHPKTHNRVWLMVNAVPQFDSYGLFLYVLVTFTDITAYKKVKDELHVKNSILHSIDEFSLDIMSIIDEQGSHIYVSKSATTISGYSNQELMQLNALDLMPEKDKPHMQALLNTVRVEGQLKNVLGKLVCKDGSIKYISWGLKWDAVAELIYVNGRDKTQVVMEARALEAKRIADEQQQRHLIYNTEEQKRHGISYELHENVGQLIATVKMYLHQYEKSGAAAILDESKNLLATCIDELRAITYINAIPKFEDVGFANAIEILMQLQFKKQEVVLALQLAVNEAAISDFNRINIFRLLQLWFSHIVNRGELVSVIVDVLEDGDLLTLQITDEVKFPLNYTDYLSPDLMPIKERLNIIGGTMHMKPSADNKCFTITFSLKKEC
jgi:PAS domain S-box-containing protein